MKTFERGEQYYTDEELYKEVTIALKSVKPEPFPDNIENTRREYLPKGLEKIDVFAAFKAYWEKTEWQDLELDNINYLDLMNPMI